MSNGHWKMLLKLFASVYRFILYDHKEHIFLKIQNILMVMPCHLRWFLTATANGSTSKTISILFTAKSKILFLVCTHFIFLQENNFLKENILEIAFFLSISKEMFILSSSIIKYCIFKVHWVCSLFFYFGCTEHALLLYDSMFLLHK